MNYKKIKDNKNGIQSVTFWLDKDVYKVLNNYCVENKVSKRMFLSTLIEKYFLYIKEVS